MTITRHPRIEPQAQTPEEVTESFSGWNIFHALSKLAIAETLIRGWRVESVDCESKGGNPMTGTVTFRKVRLLDP